jgi:hypothetical protein
MNHQKFDRDHEKFMRGHEKRMARIDARLERIAELAKEAKAKQLARDEGYRALRVRQGRSPETRVPEIGSRER